MQQSQRPRSKSQQRASTIRTSGTTYDVDNVCLSQIQIKAFYMKDVDINNVQFRLTAKREYSSGIFGQATVDAIGGKFDRVLDIKMHTEYGGSCATMTYPTLPKSSPFMLKHGQLVEVNIVEKVFSEKRRWRWSQVQRTELTKHLDSFDIKFDDLKNTLIGILPRVNKGNVTHPVKGMHVVVGVEFTGEVIEAPSDDSD